MTTTNEHLARLHLLRQAKEKTQHLRPLATQSALEAHLSGEVDQTFIENCDTAKAYREQIDGFDISSTREAALTRLESISTGSTIDNILEPVFLSLLDGTMRAFNMGTKQGLTPSRLYNECKVFTYANAANSAPMLDSYTEFRNEQQNVAAFGSQSSYSKGVMSRNGQDLNMRDGKKMAAAKDAHFGDELRAADEYDNKAIYKNKNHAKSEGVEGQAAEADHIVPCVDICNRLKSNKALHPEDIKNIINIEENIAITSQQNNRGQNTGKFAKSRGDLQKEIDQGYTVKNNGKKHQLTDEEKKARQTMIQKMDDAQKDIDTKTNETVTGNILHDGKVQKVLAKDAANAASHLALGNAIIFAIKPLYFELSDCISHGIEEGVGANSFASALKIRLGRMKEHVLSQALPLLKDVALGIFKNFLSMLMEGIVNCFVGVFKQIMRLVKEGFKILMNAVPILTDEKTTMAQKGDALIKLVAGSLSIFAAIGIESWLSSAGMPEWAAIILSSILTAVITALVMFLLDKLDLFGVNRQLKLRRIDEILSSDIEEAKQDMFASIAQLT